MPDDAGWHPNRDEWVWPEQCDPVAAIDAALLRELCTGEPGPTLSDAGRMPAGPELAALLARRDPAAADAYDVVEAVAGYPPARLRLRLWRARVTGGGGWPPGWPPARPRRWPSWRRAR
ncbi:hypothetical protein C1I92_18825 [Jiangella anatolica]|uniref:Uncharacterized protein n=2 Tax=Jiangella anatolica TaxID=2670374 RepID=A0A2W2BNS8_9ACTN|nr:hypothetical protein C1I92_18825 [Jiangella anatolica]